MVTKKEFLLWIEQVYGYQVDDWLPLKSEIPSDETEIFTMGKDEDGYFTYGSVTYYANDNEILKNMGVIQWQPKIVKI